MSSVIIDIFVCTEEENGEGFFDIDCNTECWDSIHIVRYNCVNRIISNNTFGYVYTSEISGYSSRSKCIGKAEIHNSQNYIYHFDDSP